MCALRCKAIAGKVLHSPLNDQTMLVDVHCRWDVTEFFFIWKGFKRCSALKEKRRVVLRVALLSLAVVTERSSGAYLASSAATAWSFAHYSGATLIT